MVEPGGEPGSLGGGASTVEAALGQVDAVDAEAVLVRGQQAGGPDAAGDIDQSVAGPYRERVEQSPGQSSSARVVGVAQQERGQVGGVAGGAAALELVGVDGPVGEPGADRASGAIRGAGHRLAFRLPYGVGVSSGASSTALGTAMPLISVRTCSR